MESVSRSTPWTVDPEVLDSPIVGTNLRRQTLRRELGEEPTLLVFLRHLG